LLLHVCKGDVKAKPKLFFFLSCAFNFKVYLMPEDGFFLIFDPIRPPPTNCCRLSCTTVVQGVSRYRGKFELMLRMLDVSRCKGRPTAVVATKWPRLALVT